MPHLVHVAIHVLECRPFLGRAVDADVAAVFQGGQLGGQPLPGQQVIADANESRHQNPGHPAVAHEAHQRRLVTFGEPDEKRLGFSIKPGLPLPGFQQPGAQHGREGKRHEGRNDDGTRHHDPKFPE